jgi:hypothetical protein
MIGGTSTQNTNTPSIIVGDGSTGVTILAANTARIGFSIQNVGTTAASVRFGSGASATVYHFALKGGSSDNDGLGGSITFMGPTVYNGLITFFGASTAKVTALEIAP